MFDDDEPVLVLQGRYNDISITTNKIIKTNDDWDYSSEDIENIIDDRKQLGQISIHLDIL
jgi:hypothetical protein